MLAKIPIILANRNCYLLSSIYKRNFHSLEWISKFHLSIRLLKKKFEYIKIIRFNKF